MRRNIAHYFLDDISDIWCPQFCRISYKDSRYEIKVIGYLHTDNFVQILQFVVN